MRPVHVTIVHCINCSLIHCINKWYIQCIWNKSQEQQQQLLALKIQYQQQQKPMEVYIPVHTRLPSFSRGKKSADQMEYLDLEDLY